MSGQVRAHDDDYFEARILGTGSAHSIREVEDDPDTEPAIWLPEHRSGSRFGGWRRQRLPEPPRRPMGFRLR